MEHENQLEGLARRLLASTERGTIQWRDTASEDSFRVVMKNGTVRIDQVTPPDDEGPGYCYALVILNDKGKMTDTYTPAGREGHQLLEALWRAALRSARASDKVIAGLLNELSDSQ